jgi:hypothetical protein
MKKMVPLVLKYLFTLTLEKKLGSILSSHVQKIKIPAVFFKPTRVVLRSQCTKRTNYWQQRCMLPRCFSLARMNFPKMRSPGKGTHSDQFCSLLQRLLSQRLLAQHSLTQRSLTQRLLGHAALMRGEGGGARSINQRSF